jgi:hypothetical protein
MEALKLAFETVIVGVLALPWLAFELDMFFRPKNGGKHQGWSLWSFLKGEVGKTGMVIPSPVASVLLFVVAYFVGVVVTRASGDFFNDELPSPAPTEDHIRTAAYCDLADTLENEAGMTQLSRKAMETKTNGLKITEVKCGANKEAEQAIKRLFHLREGAVLLEGGERTDRLNQLHSQILVLRGAAFNGLLTFMLCLFGLCARSSRPRVWLVIPLTIVGFGFGFLFYHTHGLDDPPFMEFTCVVLGLAGGYVLWKGAPEGKYVAGSLLSLLAFVISFLGWWWTEVLYDQQVMYAYYAASHKLLSFAP